MWKGQSKLQFNVVFNINETGKMMYSLLPNSNKQIYKAYNLTLNLLTKSNSSNKCTANCLK